MGKSSRIFMWILWGQLYGAFPTASIMLDAKAMLSPNFAFTLSMASAVFSPCASY